MLELGQGERGRSSSQGEAAIIAYPMSEDSIFDTEDSTTAYLPGTGLPSTLGHHYVPVSLIIPRSNESTESILPSDRLIGQDFEDSFYRVGDRYVPGTWSEYFYITDLVNLGSRGGV